MSRSTQTMAGPSAAERIRSATADRTVAMLAVPGTDPAPIALHHLRPCGDLLVAVEANGPVVEYAHRAGGCGPAVVELTDRAPLPLREPVRSLIWLRGTLRPVPADLLRPLVVAVAAERPDDALLDVGHRTTLLQLSMHSAVLADSSGAEPVDPNRLRDAAPDPFRALEADWLRHLAADHPDVIERIARRVPVPTQGAAVHPLAIDRYGITLRVERRDGTDHDVRVPFAAPVDDVPALSRAVRSLIGCPFLNGMRAR